MRRLKLLQSKHWLSLGATLICLALIIFVPHAAHAELAGWEQVIASAVGSLVAVVMWILGKVLVLIIYIVIWVASYNGFISSPAVSIGWGIVRDVCNMFFILFLLMIAFGTILNLKQYHWTSALPKLILFAILINFSKLICGVAIDFAQVIMLTFVNGFRDIAGGNFATMTGIQGLLNIGGNSGEVSLNAIAGTYILALIYILVSLVVMTVILFVLIIRIVMLWILVVLSPLAFLLKSTEATSGYAKTWVSQFTNNVVAGPILAFFIWLAFATMQNQDAKGIFGDEPSKGADTEYYSQITERSGGPSAGLAEAGTPQGMLRFVISIGLLVGGLMMTKQLGGTVGDIAGKGLGAINKGASKVKGWGKTAAVNTGKMGAQTSLRAVGATMKGGGNLLSRSTDGRFGGSLQKSGAFVQSWGKDIQKTRQEARRKQRKKTLANLGMKAETMGHLAEAAKTPLGRSIKGGLAFTAGLATGNPFLMAAGLGHAVIASNKDNIAKGLKNSAQVMQQNRQGTNAFLRSTAIGSQMSEEYHEKEKKKENYEQSKQKDLAATEARHKDDIRGAEMSGKSQADIDADIERINEAYNKQYESIADRYARLAEQAEIEYQGKTSDQKLRNDSVLHPEYQAAKADYKTSVDRANIGKVRAEKLRGVDREEQAEMDALNIARDVERNDIKKNYSGLAQKMTLEQFDDKYKKEEKNIKDRFNLQRTEINEEYQRPKDVPVTDPLAKLVNAGGKGMDKYLPNRLTIEAAELGKKEITAAKDIVHNISDEGFERFSANTWSTGEGIDDKKKHMYKTLASGSPEGKKAIERLVADFQSIRAEGKASSKNYKDKIKSMKKGVAYFIHEEPDSKGDLKEVIDELEKLDIGDDKHKIEDYGPHHSHAEAKAESSDHKEEASGHDKGGDHKDAGAGHH